MSASEILYHSDAMDLYENLSRQCREIPHFDRLKEMALDIAVLDVLQRAPVLPSP
jgi:hypothetical protein